MATVNLSGFVRLGINANSISPYQPFSELNDKYRKQVLFASEIIEFAKGDSVFKGQRDRTRYYFLLKGKLAFKTGLLTKKTIDSQDGIARFDIGPLLPDGVEVQATDSGYLLSVDANLMDTALAWMQASEPEPEALPQAAPSDLLVVESVEEEGDDWMSSLLSSPLFFNLPPANISRVFALFERVDAAQNEEIILQGDEGHYFYALIRGKAKVLVDDNQVAELSAGSYFGEDALLSDAPRSASVIMLTKGEVGRLDRENFQSLLKDPVVKFISPEEVGKQLMKRGSKCVLIDVRSREEFAHKPSPNSRNVPCRELRAVIPGLDKDATYFISHEGGKRSELAAHLFSQAALQAFVIRE